LLTQRIAIARAYSLQTMSNRSANEFVDHVQLSRSTSDVELADTSLIKTSFNSTTEKIKDSMFSGKVMPKTYSYTKEVVYRIKEKKNSRNSLVVKGSYWFKVMTIIRIQSLARRYLVRKTRAIENEKAIIIQRAFRKYLSLTIRVTDMRKIIVVQNLYRGNCARRKLNDMKNDIIQQYLRRRMKQSRKLAAIHIQTLFLGHILRKRFVAQKMSAAVIQRVYRGYVVRTFMKNCIQDIIVVQSLYRKRQAMRDLEHIKKAIVKEYLQRGKLNAEGNVIQKAQLSVRQKRAEAKVDQMKYSEYLYKYSVLLQALSRGYLARKTIKTQNAHAAVIQRAWVDHLRGKDEQRLAATSIQRVYRGHLIVLRRMESATAIQRVYRGHETRKARDQKLRSIVIIQALAMSYIIRHRLRMRHSSATLIQSAYRRSVASGRYMNTLKSVLLLQSTFQFLQKKIIYRNRRAIIIQRAYRGYAMRANFVRNFKAIIIQSAYRGHSTRVNHGGKMRSSTLIQSVARGFLARKHKLAMVTKIVLIQSILRRQMAVRNAAQLRSDLEDRSCTRIQSHWRCHASKRDYTRVLLSIITIQSLTRRWLALKDVKLRRKERDVFNIHLFQLSNCTGEVDIELCLNAFEAFCFCDQDKKFIMQSQLTV